MSASRSIRLSWRKKMIFSTITVLAIFCFLEILLGCIGYRPSIRMNDPFVGFAPGVPLFVKQGDQYQTNEIKLTFFNQQSFPVRKLPNAKRIFCLGESTTYGHPFDDRLAYPAWLQAYLTESYPDRDWQVINCGGISYASYRLAVLMEELVNYEPDVFIFYVGHNEFLEERTYHDIRELRPELKRAIHWASYSRSAALVGTAIDSVRSTKTPSCQLSAEVDTILERSLGPEAYHRDARLNAGVLSHYRFSLTKMIQLAKKSGAAVIVVQPASNLRDFSPFKAQPGILNSAASARWQTLVATGRQELQAGRNANAVEHLQQAVELDPLNATGWWFLGHAHLESHQHEDALRCLTRSKDEDVCPLRATTAIQRIVAEVAHEQRVALVNFPQILATRCQQEMGHDVVGVECFLDHVHPTNECHADLGRALFERLAVLQVVPRASQSDELSQRVNKRIMSAISGDYFGLALQRLAMTLSWAGKNVEAMRISDIAIKAMPDNAEAWSQHGRLMEKLLRYEEALHDYEKAVSLNPLDSLALSRLGGFRLQRGRYSEAHEHLRRAIELTPPRAPIAFRYGLHLKMGDCEQALGNAAEAERHYRAAIAIDETSPQARERLTALHRDLD